MDMTGRVAVSVAAVALIVAMSHPVLGAARDTHRPASATRPTPVHTTAVDVPKLTVRLTPLVRVTRGDASGVVVVPRHVNNRVLRVVLESEDYYRLSDVQLDGEDAPQSHSFYWRDVPPGSYRVAVRVYGTEGLRGSTSIGTTEPMSQER
jgi:hypothetical protein